MDGKDLDKRMKKLGKDPSGQSQVDKGMKKLGKDSSGQSQVDKGMQKTSGLSQNTMEDTNGNSSMGKNKRQMEERTDVQPQNSATFHCFFCDKKDLPMELYVLHVLDKHLDNTYARVLTSENFNCDICKLMELPSREAYLMHLGEKHLHESCVARSKEALIDFGDTEQDTIGLADPITHEQFGDFLNNMLTWSSDQGKEFVDVLQPVIRTDLHDGSKAIISGTHGTAVGESYNLAPQENISTNPIDDGTEATNFITQGTTAATLDIQGEKINGSHVPVGPRPNAEGNKIHISLGVLRLQFGKPVTEVAENLGVSKSTLRRISKEYGIRQWPSHQKNKVIVTMKVSYGPSAFMLFKLNTTSTFRDLQEEIMKRLEWDSTTFETKYKDEANDWITIFNDEDFKECLEASLERGKSRVSLSVNSKVTLVRPRFKEKKVADDQEKSAADDQEKSAADDQEKSIADELDDQEMGC